MKKKLHMIVVTLVLSMLLVGCGAPDTAQTTSYVPQTVVENTPKPETEVKEEEPTKEETEIVSETAEPKTEEEAEGTEEKIGTEKAGVSEEEEEKEVKVKVEEPQTTPAPEFGSLEAINAAASTRATCEDPAKRKLSWSSVDDSVRKACTIDTDSDINPYDVIYDYGEDFNAYVEACDWSLVFDADYYMELFPMLALQYHYDEDLLLMHFQTVGIHEGRQGSEDFNLGAYYYNCDYEVYKAFEQNYAAYYIYYMLNYDTEKTVNTVTADNGKPVKQQYKSVLTWYQAVELQEVNKYREEAGSDPVEFDSELAAFAMYRAYLNAHDDYEGHDWLADPDNNKTVESIILKMAPNGFHLQENTNTTYSPGLISKQVADQYYKSPDHRDAMVNPDNVCIGISGLTSSDENRKTCQFDVYLNDTIDTVMHPAD